MTTRPLLFAVGITILATALVALLDRPVASVEDQITILK